MSDRYRLLFRGEVLDGQHAAVVRKRLGESAGFTDAALEKLFSGRIVVVKQDVDAATANRFETVFRRAGARLERKLLISADPRTGKTEAASDQGTTPGEPDLLPAGSDLLRADERTPWQPRDVDTSSLSLAGAQFTAPERGAEAFGPDVSHLTLAAPGADLGAARTGDPSPVQTPDFELAEAGADLQQHEGPAPPPPPDVSHLHVAKP